MSSSATGVGMTICFLGAILLILTQKSSQKFGDVLGIFYVFLRVSSANIGKIKLSLKALTLSAFTFICFLVFSNAFRRTKIFLTSLLSQFF